MAELIHKQDIYDAVDLLMTRFPYKVPGRPDTYHPYNEAWHDACSHVLDVIRDFSPADVAPVKHGHWIDRLVEIPDLVDDPYHYFKRRFYCSSCGEWQTYGKTDYCPMCGAYMRGENDG